MTTMERWSVVDHEMGVEGADHALVLRFHAKFGLPLAHAPRALTREEYEFRRARLLEEIEELDEAYGAASLPGMADALVDLNYIAHGTAAMMGIPWSDVFAAVHAANMHKRRVEHPGESRFGSAIDVVKPDGWVGPDVDGILRAWGMP